MNETIHDTVVKELLKEMLGDGVNCSPYFQSIITNYINDFREKSGAHPNMDKEALREGLNNNTLIELMIKASKSQPFKDTLYNKTYERLKALSEEEGITWGNVFPEIYDDEHYLNDIFVRLVEEQEGVVITSAKQLQELTGITEIYGCWDEEKQDTVPYGDKELTKKEAQELAIEQLEDCFIEAMSYRYSKALKDILNAGGKYKDLLELKPSYFNLPATWSGKSDPNNSILWAIEDTFLIGEPTGTVRPDLKAIAREIEAPYSILLEAHKMCH